MINLIIASAQKDKMRPWSDALKSLYPLFFFDNLEQALSEKKLTRENILLVLDASLLTDSRQLRYICQSFYKVLIVYELCKPDQKIQYIYEGAWGYSDYAINQQLIVRTIESILNNEVWLERQLIPQLLQGVVARSNLRRNIDEFNTEALSSLTQREIEVTKLVYHGDDIATISQTLNISNRTVKAHLAAVYRKLDVPDRFRLIVYLKNLDVGLLSNVNNFFEASHLD